ncbi:MobF family relaxase [Glycomyces artemisiae]|uniref:MobF family relaxase n=1 Tax=Glycomyces artemisiae TaxID=1076443 RepID=UPI0011B20AA9|nr:MobF family relaxase [Glycomyces artemisiae]
MTTLGPDAAQVEYRLSESAGCAVEVVADAQADYRLDESQTVLEWVGGGLAEVGIEAGTPLEGEEAKAAARALMDGADPSTGEALVSLKKAVDPRAKLASQPLVDAIAAAAAEAGIEPKELFEDPRRAAEFGRLARGVARNEDRHFASITLLSRVAAAAGIDLDVVYGEAKVAEAHKHQAKRVTVGNRGYDLVVDVPKSYSVLQAIAPEELAQQLDAIFRESVRETVGAVETWAAWGQRGHHGGGRTADRIESSGVLGWSMTHYTARPVDGAMPDPHLHAHLTIANMIRGKDGRWSALGAGGRDLHRHAVAANAFLEARVRSRTSTELGIAWVQDERTGAWEVAAVPRQLREAFSKRHAQIAPVQDASDKTLTPAVRNAIAEASREGKNTASLAELREDWRDQARAAGFDPDRLAAAAVPEVPAAFRSLQAAFPVREAGPDVEAIAAAVWHPGTGLCAHRKVVSRADVLAAVADQTEHGVADLAALGALADRVLAVPGYAVRMDADLPGTLSSPQRYTQADIVAAEQTILAAARTRMNQNIAVVDGELVDAAIATFEAGAGFALSPEQRAVVERLATAGHGVDAVIGVAGSGKTTLMEALASAHAAAGHVVAGASTAAIAAQHLQAETGIPAMTIASWLGRIEAGPGLAGVDVLVVDEAAMVDDRQAARLVDAAGRSGTQIIGIGDPLQLRSPGVGGTFKDVHELVDGLTLTDNRRQRHETEVAALARWREGDRRAVFDALSDRDAVHAEARLDGVWEAMIGSWWATVRDVRDPHERLRQHLMIAATNADVTTLNAAAQAIRIAEGELDPAAGRDYRIEGGALVHLHVGDVVAARANDYSAGLLNGNRGVVTGIGEDGTLTVEILQAGPDGPVPVPKTVREQYVRFGDLTLGYALTGHRAQGQSAETVHASLTGMDAHAAYSVLTRHRERVDVWLAADVLEDDAARARLGEPADDTERARRAVDAYLEHLDRPEPDGLAVAGLAEHARLLEHRRTDAKRPIGDKIAEARERAAAARELFGGETEAAVEPAAADVDVAAVRPWQDLDTRELYRAAVAAARGVKKAEERLDHAREYQAWYEGDLNRARLDRADAEDGQGPAVARLEQQREHLAAAAGHARDIVEHIARYQTARQAETEADRTAKDARLRAAENPIKLRIQGTSRNEQREIVQDAIAAARAAAAEQQGAGDRIRASQNALGMALRDLPRGTGGTDFRPDPAKVLTAHEDLETHWEDRRAEAVQEDVAAVREPDAPRTTIAAATTRVANAKTKQQGLAAELAHRAATPEGEQEIAAARSELQAEVRAAQRARAEAQRQAEQEARIHPPSYDHYPRPDNGPSMGMSR